MAFKEILVFPFFEIIPVFRTRKELFSETVVREAKRLGLSYVINANYYDLSNSGKFSALMGHDPVDAQETTVQGIVIAEKKKLAGTVRPDDFYILYDKSLYSVSKPLLDAVRSGRGDPPMQGTAYGGLGPLIIDGLPYGAVNLYKSGAPTDAPVTGEPSPAAKKYLVQRSSRKFAAFAARDKEMGGTLGKVCLGFSNAGLHLAVQEDGSGGSTISAIRDKLVQTQCKHAVFFDGSDSAMLYANGAWIIKQGENKEETCVMGLGIKVKK